MKRFVFRAQVALDVRRRRDEDAQRELAAAEMRRLAASEHLVLRYADGGVYIFEVNPGVGANGRNGG